MRGPQRRHDDRRGAAPALVDQQRQGLGLQQRRVAEQHQHVVDRTLRGEAAGECREAGAHRVAGAERRVLHDAFGRFDQARDSLHPRPDHDDRRRRRQRHQRSRCAIIGRPATGCITFGIPDFIRVPLQTARTMAANSDRLIDGSN